MQHLKIARRRRPRLRAKPRRGVKPTGLKMGHGLLQEALKFCRLHSLLSRRKVGADNGNL